MDAFSESGGGMAKKKATRRNLAPKPEGVAEQVARAVAIIEEHFDAAVLILPGVDHGRGNQDVAVMCLGDGLKAAGMLERVRGNN